MPLRTCGLDAATAELTPGGQCRELPMKRLAVTLLVSVTGFLAIVLLSGNDEQTAEIAQASKRQICEARSADRWTFNR